MSKLVIELPDWQFSMLVKAARPDKVNDLVLTEATRKAETILGITAEEFKHNWENRS